MKIWLMAGAASILVMTGLAVPASADETQTYSYDALQRLVSVRYSGTINNKQAHSICYDPAGNRTHYRSSSTGVVSTCAVTGAATSGGDGALEPELLPGEEVAGGESPADDVHPPSEEPLPDLPPEAAPGPEGDGAALPPDPPPEGEEPPADPPPEGEGSGR